MCPLWLPCSNFSMVFVLIEHSSCSYTKHPMENVSWGCTSHSSQANLKVSYLFIFANITRRGKPSLACGAKFRVVSRSCHSVVTNAILLNVMLRYITLDLFMCLPVQEKVREVDRDGYQGCRKWICQYNTALSRRCARLLPNTVFL